MTARANVPKKESTVPRITYKYRIDHWGKDEWETVDSEFMDLSCLAEEIAQEYDARAAEYPDERVVWVQSGAHAPKKFVVSAETVRNYSAHEAK
jgi:hypothetical protein